MNKSCYEIALKSKPDLHHKRNFFYDYIILCLHQVSQISNKKCRYTHFLLLFKKLLCMHFSFQVLHLVILVSSKYYALLLHKNVDTSKTRKCCAEVKKKLCIRCVCNTFFFFWLLFPLRFSITLLITYTMLLMTTTTKWPTRNNSHFFNLKCPVCEYNV